MDRKKARIKGQHLLSRLGGFSSPFGGMTLRLPESERDVVRGVIVFLEDRRVLYSPHHLEISSQVVSSLLEIRKELTNALKRVSEESPAAKAFATMRAECRSFLTEDPPDFRHADHREWRGDMDAGFFAKLGQLRAAFGRHFAELAVLYDLDLSEDLRSILPPEPQADDEDASPDRKFWRY